MAGNVWEWCNDRHAPDLGTAGVANPTGPDTGEQRVLRGGSWAYYDPVLTGSDLRCAYRQVGADPDWSSGDYGFRIARTADPPR